MQKELMKKLLLVWDQIGQNFYRNPDVMKYKIKTGFSVM